MLTGKQIRSFCNDLVNKFYKSNSNVDESVPVIDKLGESIDVKDAWYVMIEYGLEAMEIVHISSNREKAINYARDLKQHYPYKDIKVYHDVNWYF